MAIAEETYTPPQNGRLLTAADLAALPSTLPSGSVDYALVQGRLYVMSPTGDRHGGIQAIIAARLIVQGQDRGLGKVRTEVGLVLSRDPDTVLGPDVAFIANSRLPLRVAAEDYLETIPNLVVEIRSKNDSLRETEEKAARYLAAGVELVWIIDPTRQMVIAHGLVTPPAEFGAEAVLTAENIIPGFHLPVAELFAD